jgi:UDP-glucuronate decarboxylase
MNLGNPREFTIRELADVIRDVVGSKVPFIHQPLPMDDPKQRRPDISRARETLGWEPRTQLRAGIELTVRYFDRLLSVPGDEAAALRRVG